MKKTYKNSRIGMMALVAAGMLSASLTHADKLDNATTIRITPLSHKDVILPKSGAQLFDYDGIRQSAGDVVVSPFVLQAMVGGDRLEMSVPEIRVDQLQWVADPVGCVDNDPKTKCHPTWGSEYSGQADGDVLVYVELANGGVLSDYGTVSLVLNVTVIDNKVRIIEGYLQIAFTTSTDGSSYRIPIGGKLK